MTIGRSHVHPIGIHHAGVVVSNLETSVSFYGEMFGAQPTLWVDHSEGRLVMLDLGNANLELLAYTTENRATSVPSPTDLGAGHVALLVDDVVAAYERLTAIGVHFTSGPIHVSDGPSAGYAMAFCLDPDGNRIELIQEP